MIADLAMGMLIGLGVVVLVIGVLFAGLLMHPLTAPTARAYGLRAWGVVAKWAPVLLALVGAAGVALAVERWLRGGDIDPAPSPAPAPVPSSEPERRAIREETARETQAIQAERAREGVTIGDMRRAKEQP